MKKIFFTLFILSGIILMNAQTGENPFVKYGFNKVRTYTSSKGEFEEFHDNKNVVEIGSILFDTKTNQIVGYAKEELESEVAVSTPAMSIDPLCERYYWISPYAYALNNPVRFIDPDGRDVWEINQSGEIINRIKDKTQDAFYMVAQDADGKYQRTYTTDEEGNKNYNSISFEYGTVTSVQEKNIKIEGGQEATMTMFNIKGDEKATQIFEFMANPGTTTKVEWSLDRIGTSKSEKNVVGTMHHESSTAQGYYLMKYGYSIREDIHNHPNGSNPNYIDREIGGYIQEKNPNAKFSVYIGAGKYIPYTGVPIITVTGKRK